MKILERGSMARIAYRDGYKYQAVEQYKVQTHIYPEVDIDTPFIKLSKAGLLTISAGYAWDGPSGPTFDTLNFMRGSLVHDALYQLMRERHLDPVWRETADRTLRDICIEDGMSRIRAWWVYKSVRAFAGFAADPATDKPIIYAPCVGAP